MKKFLFALFVLIPCVLQAGVTTKLNIFGGQSFYLNGRMFAQSRSSIYGGQKIYDNNGRMSHFYGNSSGFYNYRGTANFGANQGAVFQGLRRGTRNR